MLYVLFVFEIICENRIGKKEIYYSKVNSNLIARTNRIEDDVRAPG